MTERGCAKCGTTEGVMPFTLSAGAETVILELCEQHGRPIHRLIAIGQGSAPKRAPVHQVIPVD